MKCLRRGVVWLFSGVVFLGLCNPRVSADGADHAQLLDNLFLDLTGGGDKHPGEESAAFGSIGVNWGLPLNPDSDGVALGLQCGGDAILHDTMGEWDATVGAFARNLKSFGEQQAAFAFLADYRRTTLHNDLWDVRPIIGTTISKQDGIGLTGVIGINRASGTVSSRTVHQEIIDRAEAFWNRDWRDSGKVETELSVGYQFSHVNEALLGAEIVYGLTPSFDIALGGEINTAGNYAAGISASYHFGGIGRHATINNIGGFGKGLFTPFPKRRAIGLDSGTASTSFGPGGGGGFGGGGGQEF